MAEFATLTDVKAHINKSSDVDDDELVTMLDAAEDIVRSLVGSFAPVAVTETVAATGSTILLSRRPTGAVTVTDYFGNAVTGFNTNAPARLLKYVPYAWGPFTVSYAAGDGVVPAAVNLATAIIAAHLWETQRGTSPSALALQQFDTDATAAPGIGYAIPNRAKDLLEPYMQRSQLA